MWHSENSFLRRRVGYRAGSWCSVSRRSSSLRQSPPWGRSSSSAARSDSSTGTSRRNGKLHVALLERSDTDPCAVSSATRVLGAQHDVDDTGGVRSGHNPRCAVSAALPTFVERDRGLGRATLRNEQCVDGRGDPGQCHRRFRACPFACNVGVEDHDVDLRRRHRAGQAVFEGQARFPGAQPPDPLRRMRPNDDVNDLVPLRSLLEGPRTRPAAPSDH